MKRVEKVEGGEKGTLEEEEDRKRERERKKHSLKEAIIKKGIKKTMEQPRL